MWVKARVKARNVGEDKTPEDVIKVLCADIKKLKEDSQTLVNLYEGKVLPFPRVVSPELHKKNQNQRDSFRKEQYDEITYLQNQGFHLGHIANIMQLTTDEVNDIIQEFSH
jgi:regulator of replication initiation timing